MQPLTKKQRDEILFELQTRFWYFRTRDEFIDFTNWLNENTEDEPKCIIDRCRHKRSEHVGAMVKGHCTKCDCYSFTAPYAVEDEPHPCMHIDVHEDCDYCMR